MLRPITIIKSRNNLENAILFLEPYNTQDRRDISMEKSPTNWDNEYKGRTNPATKAKEQATQKTRLKLTPYGRKLEMLWEII